MEGDNKQPQQIDQLQPELLTLQSYLQEPDPMSAFISADIINPVALGFIPKMTWANKGDCSIQELIETYFSRKNSVSRRFEHKLWNCLKITTAFPNLIKTIGVCWVTDKIIKVYKHPFAKTLSITCVDGGLFHKQGNFTRHGFVDLSEQEAQRILSPEQLEDVDYKDVHVIIHSQGIFNINATEESISNCKWENPSPANRVASLAIVQPNDTQTTL